MWAVLGVFSLILFPIALIIGIVQAIRKKPSKKAWLSASIILLGVFGALMAISIHQDGVRPAAENPKPTESQAQVEVQPTESLPSVETESPVEPTHTEKTEAEKFAEENGLSVELAEDIEQALAQSEYSYALHQIYSWKQIDDYAYGQRYTGWLDMEYVWVFYVRDDRLESIRQQKDLAFIYQAEE